MSQNKKQERLKELVNRGVLRNQSMLVTSLVEQGFLDYPDNPPFEADESLSIPAICDNCAVKADRVDKNSGLCEDCHADNPLEIFEWWLVSEWFSDHLKAQDEIVISDDESYWWGRQTTGQAIYLDGVIERIAKNLNANIA